jgi:hypothetical protein
MAGSFYDALKSGEIKGLADLERRANDDAIQAAGMAAGLPHVSALEHETDAAELLARDLIQELPSHHIAYLLAVILVRKVRENVPTVPAPVSAADVRPIQRMEFPRVNRAAAAADELTQAEMLESQEIYQRDAADEAASTGPSWGAGPGEGR